MSTSYTKNVSTGKTTSFKEFAISCAANFNVYPSGINDNVATKRIFQRDISLSYQHQALKNLVDKLDELLSMKDEELRNDFYYPYLSSIEKGKRDNEKERKQIKERCEIMLEKAKKFSPNRALLSEFKCFLISQLEITIEANELPAPHEQAQPFKEWKQEKIDNLIYNIRACNTQIVTQEAKTKEKNKWICALETALAEAED